ncbi:Rieske 2Fe-2S family protein, putative [Penicillium digitatum]|uniref:Rieske 2Fe-2S family protein, putative n=3 Tax=Penicillium digitatum TaxID=36651 RepID=K9FQL7_PEND2|nr:Rieske 2Fe-2S family protein, putative [Penicillium digitatum Pd1]EKV11454.1 Rieske 2Fe-2S family protein, putative [Penicillium digitatum PHI26]EKV20131.1 Rieske 2Fe-2S family protein, putative [Penicillium digitatum Pd1]QQK39482.1 Rieske 2Fe-2S family protein, putative [Penicillium digitatum]
MSTLKNSFRLGEVEGLPTSANDDSPAHPLPASWYSSQDMHELERRAIFSRKWLLTTHKLRFSKTGDWLRYDIAGYAFILVKDREGNVNAFHNICRHRAFPVVTEERGTSQIFSCQYHGWSYSLNGKLAKAPGYQELEGFDKSKNGLLPIHVHIDVNGFVWVNLDAGKKPEISWEDDFKGIDFQSRFERFNFENYNFNHAWEMSGNYNWKILADKDNESYFPLIFNFSSHAMDIRDVKSTPEEIANGLNTASAYYFPNAAMTVSPHFFFMQRLVPTGPTTCSVRYEVYRNKNSSDDEFDFINQTYKRMMPEKKCLCAETQKNVNTEVSVNDQLHRTKEGLVFQTLVRRLIAEHHKREEDAGEQFWPAQQRLPKEEAVSKDDMDFCSKLTSNNGSTLTAGGCCGGGCGGGPPTIAATAPETVVIQ